MSLTSPRTSTPEVDPGASEGCPFSYLASRRLMIAVVSGARPNVFAERFSRERCGLRAEPVVEAAGAELLGGTLYELAARYEGVPLHIH